MLARCLFVLLALAVLACARPSPRFEGTFELPDNALAYENGLVWEYEFDERGRWVGKRREPPPEYSHRCFAQVRTVRLYFQYARFAPELPRVSRERYRELAREVHAQNPRRRVPPAERIVIPGYASLYQFTMDHGDLVKEVDGGIWRSYVQRGNWRMVIPFSRGHQERMSREVMESIDRNRPAILRFVRFPRISVNHTVVAYRYGVGEQSTTFQVYDPNLATAPRPLVFDHEERRFYYVRTDYFPGGPVDVYEIFDGLFF